MFFSTKNFSKQIKHLSEDQLEHIARVANEIINEKGIFVTGNADKEGNVANFSSLVKEDDMHKAILIGLKERRIFCDDDLRPSRRDLPNVTEEDSREDVVEQLRAELREARGVIDRREKK